MGAVTEPPPRWRDAGFPAGGRLLQGGVQEEAQRRAGLRGGVWGAGGCKGCRVAARGEKGGGVRATPSRVLQTRVHTPGFSPRAASHC